MSTASYAQGKRVQNLHLTRERDRRRGRELATFLLAGLPVACALLVYAALHIETVRVGYAREARVRRVLELDDQNRQLRAELARASSPERVASLAARRKLHPPVPGQIQYVEAPAPPVARP
jgi:cell division protein FtsL